MSEIREQSNYLPRFHHTRKCVIPLGKIVSDNGEYIMVLASKKWVVCWGKLCKQFEDLMCDLLPSLNLVSPYIFHSFMAASLVVWSFVCAQISSYSTVVSIWCFTNLWQAVEAKLKRRMLLMFKNSTKSKCWSTHSISSHVTAVPSFMGS